jgi:flagellar biosynthesis/type III secretory pathway protein FliH
MKKKDRREDYHFQIAQAYNEGYQLGYKAGEKDALRKLQNNNNAETNRQPSVVSDVPKLQCD